MVCTVWTCESWGGRDCVMIYRYNSDRITFVTGQCMPACESTQRTCLYSSHIEAIETVKWYKCEIPRYARSDSTQSVNLLKARISAFQLIWRLSISAVNHGWRISVQRCISSFMLFASQSRASCWASWRPWFWNHDQEEVVLGMQIWQYQLLLVKVQDTALTRTSTDKV